MKQERKIFKIGDLVTVKRGASPRPIKDYIDNEGMPWVKISDATSNNTRYINETKEFIKKEGIEKSVIVNKGDLIVSNSATPGLPKIMNINACIHDGWLYFKNYQNILKEYLYYYFIFIKGNLINQANGSVFKNLKTDIVKEFEISLPYLNEQKRIVDILECIDKKIELNYEINNKIMLTLC